MLRTYFNICQLDAAAELLRKSALLLTSHAPEPVAQKNQAASLGTQETTRRHYLGVSPAPSSHKSDAPSSGLPPAFEANTQTAFKMYSEYGAKPLPTCNLLRSRLCNQFLAKRAKRPHSSLLRTRSQTKNLKNKDKRGGSADRRKMEK